MSNIFSVSDVRPKLGYIFSLDIEGVTRGSETVTWTIPPLTGGGLGPRGAKMDDMMCFQRKKWGVLAPQGSAETDDHRLGSLEQQIYLLAVLEARSLKSGCRQSHASSETLGRILSCFFIASGGGR